MGKNYNPLQGFCDFFSDCFSTSILPLRGNGMMILRCKWDLSIIIFKQYFNNVVDAEYL